MSGLPCIEGGGCTQFVCGVCGSRAVTTRIRHICGDGVPVPWCSVCNILAFAIYRCIVPSVLQVSILLHTY